MKVTGILLENLEKIKLSNYMKQMKMEKLFQKLVEERMKKKQKMDERFKKLYKKIW
jgi:hypothetical protein